jgi:hypothetical protein
MSKLHELIIPNYWPARLNTLLRVNYHERAKLLLLDAQIIGIECVKQNIPKATGRRRVSFVIRYNNAGRCPDPDSILKSALDGLKNCGRLRDDNRVWFELGSVTFEFCNRIGIVIVLEDLPDGH